MDGWMDGWIVGWMNGWKDGGMAGLKNKHKENRVFFYRIFRNSSHTFWLVLVINKHCCF